MIVNAKKTGNRIKSRWWWANNQLPGFSRWKTPLQTKIVKRSCPKKTIPPFWWDNKSRLLRWCLGPDNDNDMTTWCTLWVWWEFVVNSMAPLIRRWHKSCNFYLIHPSPIHKSHHLIWFTPHRLTFTLLKCTIFSLCVRMWRSLNPRMLCTAVMSACLWKKCGASHIYSLER